MSPEWQRAIVNLATIIATAACIVLLAWARSICIPIALAIFLSFILGPPMTWLQRRGLGRGVAVAVVVSLALCISAGIGTVIIQQTMRLAQTLPDREEAIRAKVAEARQFIVGHEKSRLGQLVDDIMAMLFTKSDSQIVAVESASQSWVAQLNSYGSPAIEVLGQTAFTFILTIFMLFNREDMRNRMLSLLGHGRVTTTTKAVDDGSRRISRYLLMQMLVNASFGAIIICALIFMSVPYAVLWGFIAALMRYIPYIGTWIAVIPAALYSLAISEGWAQPIEVFVLFIGLELICGNFVEPRVYGASMGLSEVAQLISAAFWAFLWGPIGLILSGPLTVCLLVLGKYVQRFEFLEILLGNQPPLEPKIAFYQRLAAHDQDEAARIALEVTKTSSPEAAFDTVIIPALSLARRDHEFGDLEERDLKFAVRAVREIADEVVSTREPAKSLAKVEPRIRVLLVAARDLADMAAIEMFSYMLDAKRWEIELVSNEMLASELVEKVLTAQPKVVVLAAIPPGGVSNLRYLVTRLRSKNQDIKLAVGRWGVTFNENRSEHSISGTDGVDLTLADSCKRLNDWYPVLMASQEKKKATRELIGTPNA